VADRMAGGPAGPWLLPHLAGDSDLAARHLAELLRQEPLIRSSLDQLKALARASGTPMRGPTTPKKGGPSNKKRAATRRGPQAP